MERVLLEVIGWGAEAVQGPLGREGVGRAGASAGGVGEGGQAGALAWRGPTGKGQWFGGRGKARVERVSPEVIGWGSGAAQGPPGREGGFSRASMERDQQRLIARGSGSGLKLYKDHQVGRGASAGWGGPGCGPSVERVSLEAHRTGC